MAAVVARRHGLRAVLAARRSPILILVCIAGLSGNYLLYQSGLRFISPDTAQVMVQLSPVFVLIGGLILYRETFSPLQWLGFVILMTGMVLFLNPHYRELFFEIGDYAFGVLLVLVAAILWAAYMLAQKQLLASMAPETILLVIYAAGSVVLLPWARPAAVFALENHRLTLLLAVTVMTMASYLSFGAAMNHLEASRLGVVVALTPLLTVAVTALAASLFPGTPVASRLNALSVAGAVMVVIGSMLSANAR
jgi:drug/metabolite transporter (DMT)-like permease